MKYHHLLCEDNCIVFLKRTFFCCVNVSKFVFCLLPLTYGPCKLKEAKNKKFQKHTDNLECSRSLSHHNASLWSPKASVQVV